MGGTAPDTAHFWVMSLLLLLLGLNDPLYAACLARGGDLTLQAASAWAEACFSALLLSPSASLLASTSSALFASPRPPLPPPGLLLHPPPPVLAGARRLDELLPWGRARRSARLLVLLGAKAARRRRRLFLAGEGTSVPEACPSSTREPPRAGAFFLLAAPPPLGRPQSESLLAHYSGAGESAHEQDTAAVGLACAVACIALWLSCLLARAVQRLGWKQVDYTYTEREKAFVAITAVVGILWLCGTLYRALYSWRGVWLKLQLPYLVLINSYLGLLAHAFWPGGEAAAEQAGRVEHARHRGGLLDVEAH
mmetsp:Transcript_48248/g.160883  ORF Transcript_48248/g.160883 Transcript_48248/m.160883 type:complete len:309 (+) Transcript_48248:832-1758(+)